MADGFVHTVHKDGGWVNTIEGGDGLDDWHPRNRRRRRSGKNRSAKRVTPSM